MVFEYKNVLIALDNSELSRKAFDRAIHIAKRDNANLILAHVIDTQNFSIIKAYLDNLNDVYEQSKANAEKKLEEYEYIAKDAGIRKIKKIIKFGSPKNVLVEEIIPEENIDLVMLGATGINSLERVLLGSVAESAFRYSKCDVFVVRKPNMPGNNSGMDYEYKQILIAVDGSDLSKEAFNRSIQIAKRDNAKLILAHVIDEKYHEALKSYSENSAIEMLKEYEQISISRDFFNLKKIIKIGSPKNVLIEEIIPEENIDLVILGATGQSKIERVLAGNVSETVFRHSKSDVLVVR